MNIWEREYDVYVILGNPALPPIWLWERWLPVAELIDPLVAAARGRAAVKSFQCRPGPGSPNQRGISFGRIDWSMNGHRKWVHAGTCADGKGAPLFESTEVWAPSWTVCEREWRMPDLYFGFHNEADLFGPQVQFNPLIVLSVARDQSEEVLARGRGAAEVLAEHVGALLRAYQRRPWGRPYPLGGFTAGIDDFLLSGLFKPGPRHDTPPSFQMLTETWQSS